MSREKVVVFTGAGVSAESGIQTFRDSDGLWHNYSIEDVCTPEAWVKNPELVLEFYNARRKNSFDAEPNKAHLAIADLQSKFNVTVITQNVDNLHERAGSSNVVHVHGELVKARSTADESLVYDIGSNDINIGDTCDLGSQLRPHIVWFGEMVPSMGEALHHISQADKVLVVGTSLSVFPVAGLVRYAPSDAEKHLVSLDLENPPSDYDYIQEKAGIAVPDICSMWMH